MTRSFAAALRRANRLMRPARLGKAAKVIRTAMTGIMITSALAPLGAVKPKTTRGRKATVPKVGRTLKAVLRQLRAAQPLMPGGLAGSKARPVSPRIPEGAQYLTRRHRSVAGARGYKLYLSASRAGRPKGPIVMLHGCNQTPDDFAVGTQMNALAEKHGLAVAWPTRTKGHNGGSCWNWFRPGDQVRGVGEPAVLATVSTGSNPVRRIVFQGDADGTVHPSNAAMIVAAALGRAALPTRTGGLRVRGRGYLRSDYAGSDGAILLELWLIEGAGHAWSGGRPAGSYTDSKGPDASAQMIRFFLADSG